MEVPVRHATCLTSKYLSLVDCSGIINSLNGCNNAANAENSNGNTKVPTIKYHL
jgi:hypothetical protein